MERRTQREHSVEENSVGFVFCLSIDLIGSTEAGLELTTQRRDRFNISLVNQIRPHLEELGLTDSLVKFTGDGWLVMTERPKDIPALCCLATIMVNRFQDEMSERTGITIDKIPSLRLAICSGRDVSVERPNEHKDWVGDSARRATRASGLCYPNEILINEATRDFIFRDFHIKPVNLEQRIQPEKWEEAFTLYTLGELKPEATAESEAPEYFVYTFSIIGKVEEATTVARQVSERLGDKASKLGSAEVEALEGILQNWNRLMASLSDYSSALEILKGIQDAGLAPDVATYNTLIDKAPDYDVAEDWVEKMRAEGIQPDVVTYNTLIDKAPDYRVEADRASIRNSDARENQVLREKKKLRQLLVDAKYILEHPPTNGFDYSPKPNFRVVEIDEALSTSGAFDEQVERKIRRARDVLFQVDQLIAEVVGIDDPVLRRNVRFRQRFPVMKDGAIASLDKAISVLGESKSIEVVRTVLGPQWCKYKSTIRWPEDNPIFKISLSGQKKIAGETPPHFESLVDVKSDIYDRKREPLGPRNSVVFDASGRRYRITYLDGKDNKEGTSIDSVLLQIDEIETELGFSPSILHWGHLGLESKICNNCRKTFTLRSGEDVQCPYCGNKGITSWAGGRLREE